MISAPAAVRLFTQTQSRMQNTITSDPLVTREIKYFQERISTIKTARELVSDYRVLKFVTRAFGLQDLSYAKSFLQKLMEGGLAREDAMANKLTDRRFKTFASTFNFGDLGESTTLISAKMQNVIDQYKRQILEDRAGQINPAARIALYFERKAPEIQSGMSFIADRALLEFARTAYGIPALTNTSERTIDNAAALIERKIDISKLRDPAEVQKAIARFANMWEVKNPITAASPSSLVSPSANMVSDILLNSVRMKYSSY
jgi:hypothetical protein